MAVKAAKRLEPFNKNVLEAAEFYAAHLEREKDSVPVATAIDEYLSAKKRAGLSGRHIRDIEGRIGRFKAQFGERLIKTVTVQEIETWLHALELGPQSTIRRRASRKRQAAREEDQQSSSSGDAFRCSPLAGSGRHRGGSGMSRAAPPEVGSARLRPGKRAPKRFQRRKYSSHLGHASLAYLQLLAERYGAGLLEPFRCAACGILAR
jgi:hypothetical protein